MRSRFRYMTNLIKYSNNFYKFQFYKLISNFDILKKTIEEKYKAYLEM